MSFRKAAFNIALPCASASRTSPGGDTRSRSAIVIFSVRPHSVADFLGLHPKPIAPLSVTIEVDLSRVLTPLHHIMDSPTAKPNGTGDSSRRKSGREIRRPDHFAEEEHVGSLLSIGSAKRKRASTANGADTKNDDDDDDLSEHDESDDDTEGSPDEEEMREKRTVRRKKGGGTEPGAKRAKTGNGANTTLAIRSANIQSKPVGKRAKTQKARARSSQINNEGLFAEVFGRGQSSDDAVNIWIKSMQKENVAAIRDLINFIFECIGCGQTVTSPDIEDIDNVPNKLGDILEEYAQSKTSEYPLISKARQYAEFRTVLVDFFTTLMQTLHSQGVLYDQPEIYDNIHVWIATMSGANYRPFRHTATVISLSLTSALCQVANELQQSIATTKTQVDTEKKKKGSNKSRLSTMNDSMKAEEKKLEAVDNILRDAFDTVYVHRYRDVDERIRVECVGALGQWLLSYRKMFLEGQYLRYLGWIMSDPHSPTRLEVVRVLKSLFKGTNNIPALRAFTDRFRSRMVEMGARDADLSVRAESIELLDRLRNAELLEPDDIDTIGRLIFDSEPRVRKAVAKFFVSNVEDLYIGCIEDWDKSEYKAALPSKVAGDEYQSPIQAWIKFKCIAQTLESYEASSQSEHGEDNPGTLRYDDWDSRYMLATQSIYPHLKELHEWESLAGYILYDHSSIPAETNGSQDMSQAVQGVYKIAAGEEIVLLDVLFFSVKMYLDSVLDQAKDKKGRTNAVKKVINEKRETAAHNLSTIIPQLLSRYGSTPQAARAVLRLEQLLDISLIDDVQGGEATHSSILEDVKEQFLSHSDPKVLAEASNALRAARAYEPSREAVDVLIHEVWADSSTTLQNLLRGKTVDTRGTLDRNVLGEVVNHCSRLANLASISDCSPVLEARFSSKKPRGKTLPQATLLDLLLALVRRGVPDEETTEAFVEKEDQLCSAVLTIISFYFRWKIVALRNAIVKNDTEGLSSNKIAHLVTQQTNFIDSISPVITAQEPLSQLRVSAITTVLDLYTLFATTKHTQPQDDDLDEDIAAHIRILPSRIPQNLMNAILHTHDKLSRSFARKTNRKLTFPSSDKTELKSKSRGREAEQTQEDIERPPEDSDDDDDNVDNSDADTSSDGQEVVGESKTAKKQAALVAERGLCEITSKIVLALLGGVVEDKEGVKERLEVNRTRLGKSYGQVVAYLDRGMGAKGKGRKKQQKTPLKKVLQAQEMELPDDEIEEDEDEVEAEEGGGELEDDEIEDVAEDEVVGEGTVAAEVDDEILGD